VAAWQLSTAPRSVTSYLLDDRLHGCAASSAGRLVMALPETHLSVLAEPACSRARRLRQDELLRCSTSTDLMRFRWWTCRAAWWAMVQADHVISFLRDKL